MIIKKSVLSEKIIVLCLLLIEIETYLTNMSYLRNYNIFGHISIIILIIYDFLKISKLKLEKKKLAFIILMIALGVFNYVLANNFTLLKLSLLLIGMINCDFNNVLKKDIYIKILLFIVVYISDCMGYSLKNDFFRENNEIRKSLGFNNPNTLGFFCSILFLEILYYKSIALNTIKRNVRKNRIYNLGSVIVSFMILFYITYYIANSRTSAILMSVSLIVYILIYIKRKEVKNLSKGLFVFFILLCFIISILLPILYNSNIEWVLRLDEKLSYRIASYCIYVYSYPISIFGNDLTLVEYPLDNAYLWSIYNIGIVGGIFYFYLFKSNFMEARKNNSFLMEIILLFLLVAGLGEKNILIPGANIFLLYYTGNNVLKIDKKANGE